MDADNQRIDPNRLTPEQAAKLLSASGGVLIPLVHIEMDLADGAPRNSDGTINLVHYGAWIVREMGRGK